MDQQPVPDRSLIGVFYSTLLKLATDDLNIINLKEHPKWARRLIDAERKRRKSSGDTGPTKAEKSMILSIAEGKKMGITATIASTGPPTVATSTKKVETINNTAITVVKIEPSANTTSTKAVNDENLLASKTGPYGEQLHDYSANSFIDELVCVSDDRRARKSSAASKNRKPSASKWSMYPELSESVDTRLKKPLNFYNVDNAELGALKEYDTYVSGVFICNARCSKRGWSSGKIAITVRLYDADQYNARIHHQRCRICDALSRPTLDADAYGERVSYRLNKWNGFKMVLPSYGSKQTAPHDCGNCEACSIGRCPHDRDDEKYIECRKHCRADT